MHSVVIRVIALTVLALALQSLSSAQGEEQKITNDNPSLDLDQLSTVTVGFLKEHSLSSEDLKGLQYYAGSTIALYRLIAPADERLASGRLITASGDTYEMVVIKRGTPGIATNVTEAVEGRLKGVVTSISISFEPKCTLDFHVPKADVESKGGRFLAYLDVDYCGFKYRVMSLNPPLHLRDVAKKDPDLRHAHESELLVDFRGAAATLNKRLVPGRTLNK